MLGDAGSAGIIRQAAHCNQKRVITEHARPNDLQGILVVGRGHIGLPLRCARSRPIISPIR